MPTKPEDGCRDTPAKVENEHVESGKAHHLAFGQVLKTVDDICAEREEHNHVDHQMHTAPMHEHVGEESVVLAMMHHLVGAERQAHEELTVSQASDRDDDGGD